MSINRMDKEDVVYLHSLHSGLLFTHKKNEIRAFVMMWMDLETILLSEVSRTEKEKYYIIPLICGSLKRVQMNLFTKQK